MSLPNSQPLKPSSQSLKNLKGLDRRTFLQGAGVTISLPLLDAMGGISGSKAIASTIAATPKRMVCIGVDLSLNPDQFIPKQSGKNYELSALLKPLAKHKKDFTVFSNIDHPHISSGHRGVHAYLSGVMQRDASNMPDGNITIDQRAAEFVGSQTRFPSLCLALSQGGQMSWTRSGVAIPTVTNPADVFKALFLADKPDANQRLAQSLDENRSILDAVKGQAQWLSKRVGKHDQEKLDEYFTSVRDLEKRLRMNRAWVDKPKPKVDMKMPGRFDGWSEIQEAMPIMYELMFLALKTDSSRVVNFQIPASGASVGLDGVDSGYHALSHHGKTQERLSQLHIIEMYLSEQLNQFLNRLKAEKEAGSNLLNNTMVLYGSGMGNANSHSSRDLPILLAGGDFNHAGHMKCPNQKGRSTSLCNLYVTMLQKFGIDVDKFGTSEGSITL